MLPIVSKLKEEETTLAGTESVICAVTTSMETEARNKEPSILIEKAHLQTAKATRISCTTMQEIEREANSLDVAE
jgi:hypothetical protein